MNKPLKVLVAGLGNMGLSHALAYHNHPGYEIASLVNRSAVALPEVLKAYSWHDEFHAALEAAAPDVVSINTYTDSHAEYALAAFARGCHVFLEKPLAATLQQAEQVIQAARISGKKLVIGYILRHHPSWVRLIKEARALGPPYIFRLNLNQQSSADTWNTHKQLMQSTSPIVDCGVHYVDVMCQITDANPIWVNGIGARLSEEIKSDMYNYGHFQVAFEDGSVGWYEAGWGPMMSENAFFIKDIVSANGSVSIVVDENARSDDVDAHTKTSRIRLHRSELDQHGQFAHADSLLDMADEPNHQALCNAEQAFLYDCIVQDTDLSRHWRDAIQSLKVCLAADQSIREGRLVNLENE